MSDDCCSTDFGSHTPHAPHSHAPKTEAPATMWRDQRLWMSIAGAMLIGGGMLADALGLHAGALAAFLVAIALAIRTPAERAVRSLGKGALDINVLMVIAVAGAMVLGDWSEAAAVVWLFGIAQWLEGHSTARARRAIRSLMAVAPSTAVVRRDGNETSILAIDVRIGDLVVVRPGERIPVDGVIVAGESAVDQSPVTGESWPADKEPGDAVYAGTINGSGALDIDVLRPASDSTIARIIHLVEEAQSRRAPVQTYVEAFARRYTPVVVLLAILLAVVPPLIAGGAWSVWGYRSLVLLVVACPCALVISTPVSIVSALTSAARHGVLIKGGASLERAASIRCVAFDKTGTLTHGRVTVTDIFGVDGNSAAGVLAIAASLEARSEHPIGRAIVHHARAEGVTVAAGVGFRALPGLGAEASVAEAPAIIGSHRLFEERQLCTPVLHAHFEELSSRGATTVLVGHDGAGLGVIGLGDELRETGRQAIADLRREGVTHVALLTGDLRVNAEGVGRAFALDEVHADLLPHDKVAHISSLRARFGPVAMVGDGINDAPALAAADLGVSMGIAGAGVALETADVTLMSDELEKLPYLLRLSRQTRRNIRGNVAIALGLKVGFIALAAAGVATLWMAVLADAGASLIVTANSLRLLKTK